MRLILVAAVATLSVGCGPAQTSSTSLPKAPNARIHEFEVATHYSYVVDGITETCFLQYLGAGYGLVPVDCAKLAAKVPEAAKVITWTAAPAAPADVPASPPAP